MSHAVYPKVIDAAVAVGILATQTEEFVGSGLDDASKGGTATATGVWEVEIDATGTPDTFKWKFNGGAYTTGVSITGGAQALSGSVTITFAATTGHTLGDKWIIYGCGNKIGTFGKDVNVKKIHIVNIDGTNAADLTIARASDGAAIGASEKTITAKTTATLDFSPEGMVFDDGVLLTASAASDIQVFIIATERL